MAEITALFNERWVAVRVIDRDKESGQPLSMKILYDNPSVGDVRSHSGMDDVCIFYTGPIPPLHKVLMF